MNIAVLMACHNRRETTIRCLSALHEAVKQVMGDGGAWRFSVFLVDDGSTDGTAEAVVEWRENMPSPATLSLHVISGSGSLYWAKGMALAWREALKHETTCQTKSLPRGFNVFTHFLWLNDDVDLFPDALETLFNDLQGSDVVLQRTNARHWMAVLVGSCCDAAGCVSYGVTDGNCRLLVPAGQPVESSGWMSGNVVLVPRQVWERVGIIDEAYTHARADFDYAERLKKAGVPFFASSRFVGCCQSDWDDRMRGMPLLARIATLWHPGYCNLHDLWLIRSRYHGKVRALISCLHMIALVFRRVR